MLLRETVEEASAARPTEPGGNGPALSGRGSGRPHPTLAVVICTRGRPEALLRTLESVWTQTHLPDELIVIDDGALPAEVPRQIAARCHELGIIWRCERSRRPGLTPARNQAAELASSEVLQYLDDDVTCEPNFLAEVAAIMRDPLVGGVTATVREPLFESRSARWYQLGYRLGGWWSVGPRRLPRGPRPAVLHPAVERPREGAGRYGGAAGAVVRARWLSGAAMALRRDIVRWHRFDETLADYALGEDREMGYRLAPNCWLVESRRAVVTHRREATGRPDPRRAGYMTSYNYLAILRKTCPLGAGDWLLIGWGLAVLAAMHLLWAVVGSRRQHLDELRGMIDGLLACLAKHRFVPPHEPRPSGRTVIPSCPPAVCSIGLPWPTRSTRAGPVMARPSRAITRPARFVASPTGGRRYAVPRPEQPPAGQGRQLSEQRRVLFVTNRLEPGGAERMLLALVKHLRPPALSADRRDLGRASLPASRLGRSLALPREDAGRYGVAPLIGCLADAGPLAEECRQHGIPVFDHLLHFKTDAAVLLRLRRILREYRIDVVVVAHSGGDRMFWSTLAGRLCGVPVVVWSHWFPRPGARHFEPPNRLLYRWVKLYITLGEAHRRALVRHEHLPVGRIVVIPNAIEMERFSRTASRSEARRRLGLAEDHVAVAIIANLRREKRHDVFIEAARRLADEGREGEPPGERSWEGEPPGEPARQEPRPPARVENAGLRFFIIGDGPHGDAVRAAAMASGLSSETLRLLGARDDVPELLPGLDICCLCSDQECFSVVMLEAAVAGCAFIGPNSGCLPDFISHRETGLLIRPADAGGLTDAIRELALDANLRRRLAEAARAKVMAGHGVDAMARAFAAVLHGHDAKATARREARPPEPARRDRGS